MKQNWDEEIINIMREQGSYNNPQSLEFGVVISTSPLQIDKGGLPLFRNNLKINKQLLDYKESVEATTSTNNEHNHTITNINHKSIFNIGDSVLLYRINEIYCVMGVFE